jgi:hypothetical protein
MDTSHARVAKVDTTLCRRTAGCGSLRAPQTNVSPGVDSARAAGPRTAVAGQGWPRGRPGNPSVQVGPNAKMATFCPHISELQCRSRQITDLSP